MGHVVGKKAGSRAGVTACGVTGVSGVSPPTASTLSLPAPPSLGLRSVILLERLIGSYLKRPHNVMALSALLCSAVVIPYFFVTRAPHSIAHATVQRCQLSMKVRVGILGLPNVGKSTLFNALAQKSIAQAANFPFCTIDPNFALIAIPDKHLEDLGVLAQSRRVVPATMEWVDVAGLVRGASRGEGLGNRFLGTARECDVICHLIRVFDDAETIHVDGKVDPVADADVINLELMLADLAHAERRLEKTTCIGEERTALEAVAATLQQGMPARAAGLSSSAKFAIKAMGLLTLKPVLYTFNVDEVDLIFGREEALATVRSILRSLEYYDPSQDRFALVSAKLEAHVCAGSRSEQLERLGELGCEFSPGERPLDLLSYNVLPSEVRSLLGLGVVYTGPGVPHERSRTTRAHLIQQHALTAFGLAGRIHGDIQKGFVCAETVPVLSLLEHESYASAKDAGCVRTEGRDYTVTNGDVVLVKWNTS